MSDNNNEEDRYEVHQIPIDQNAQRQKEQDAIVENLLKNANNNQQEELPKEKHGSGNGLAKTLAGIAATAVVGGAVAMYALNQDEDVDYHTINFLYNIEEETSESKKVEIGIRVGDVTPKKVRGYRFMGWYKDELFTDAYNADDIVPLNATLYGKYMKILKVTFPEAPVGYVVTLGENQEPVAGEDYTFKIHLTENYSKSPVNVFVKAANSDESIKLTPNENGDYVIEDMVSDYSVTIEGLEINTYTVTFKNGASILWQGQIQHGNYTEDVRPADPVKEHHTFLGWGLDTASESNDIIENIGEYKITADTTFHAKFVHTEYEVQFINGEDGVLSDYTIKVKSGEYIPASLVVPTPDKASTPKYYYVFQGWSLEENGALITDFSSIQVLDTVKLYAVYKEEYLKFRLSFASCEFVDISVLVKRDGSTFTLTPNSPAEELYLYYDDVFEINCTPNEGHTVGAVLVYDDGFPTEFQGEHRDHNNDGLVNAVEHIGNTYRVTGESNIVIEVSEEVVECTVTFMNEGNRYYETKVDYGTLVTPPANPTKADTNDINYEFSHWSLSENGEEVDLSDYKITNTNTIFHAVYTQEYYQFSLNITWHEHVATEIVVNRNGNTLKFTNDTPEEDLYFHYGDIITISNTPHTGYEMDENEVTVSGSANHITGLTYQVTGNVTIVINAHINVYDVTFVNGQTNHYTTTAEHGSNITPAAEIPTKDSDKQYSYTFSHWSLEEGGVQVDFTTYEIVKDTTFYAVFDSTNIEYSVTFNLADEITSISAKITRGGSVIKTLTENSSEADRKVYCYDIIDLSYVADDGYNVSVLGTGLEKIGDYRYRVNGNGNVEITITTEVVLCTVTFYDEDGVTVLKTSNNINYGDYAVAPENPTKADTETVDYEFSHWSLTKGGDAVNVSTFAIISTDVAFYAVYSETKINNVTLNIDGEEIPCYMEVGETVYSQVESLVASGTIPEVTDMNTCGWFTDSEFVNSMSDGAVVTAGMTLYTKMATTEKINISNGAVTAINTSITGEVVIPRKAGDGTTVTTIANYGFANCNIDSVYLPATITLFDQGSFRDTNITSIVIGAKVTSLKNSCFNSCSNLQNVIFADNSVLKEIGNACFARTNLDSLKIPASVENIDTTNGLHEIPNIEFEDTTYWYFDGNVALSPEDMSTNSSLIEKLTKYSQCSLVKYASKQSEVMVNIVSVNSSYDNNTGLAVKGKSLRHIGAAMLNRNTDISYNFFRINGWFYDEELTIPVGEDDVLSGEITIYTAYAHNEMVLINKGVASAPANIPNYTDKTYAVIPEWDWDGSWTSNVNIYLTEIAASGFKDCDKLVTVYLPTTMTKIGDYAFSGCTSLETIVIHAGVTYIGANAFAGCTNLKNIIFVDGSNWYAGGTAISSSELSNRATAGTLISSTYSGVAWNKVSATQAIIELNVDGESTSYVVDKGSNVLSTVASLNTEITDMTSCGWFRDADFINSFEDTSATITTGMTLYTKMATLDKITITNGAVSAASTSIAGEVVIPRKSEDGTLVTVIANNGFKDSVGVTSIIMPTCITSIGSNAFQGCTALSNIYIYSDVTTIGDSAFNSCTSLTNITIANNSQLEKIGYGAFGSTQITEFTVPSKVSEIGLFCFDGTSLSNITFEDSSYWYMGEKSASTQDLIYLSSTDLTNMETMLELLNGNGYAPWSSCYWNKMYKLDTKLTTYNMTISAGLNNYVTTTTFAVVENSNVKEIAGIIYRASGQFHCGWFYDAELTQPIGDSDVVTGNISAYTKTSTGAIYFYTTGANYEVYSYNSYLDIIGDEFAITELSQNDSSVTVTTIAENGFKDFNTVKTFWLPATITTIKDYAFSGCTALETIVIHSGVTHIGANAFAGCTNLKNIIFVDGSNWFAGGTAISSSDLSNRATAGTLISSTYSGVAWNKVSATQAIIELNVDGESTSYLVNKGSNVLSTVASLNTEITDMTSCGWFSDAGFINSFEDASATITTGMTLYTKMATPDKLSISNGSVKWLDSTVEGEVVIPKIGSDGVLITEITWSYTCANISGVTMPGSIVKIDDAAFEGCGLLHVNLPNGITSIGAWAFNDCLKLPSIMIPASVQDIGPNAFGGCESLASIDVDVNNANYVCVDGVLFNKDKTVLVGYPSGKSATSYAIPSGVLTIDVNAFFGCVNLVSVEIPASVMEIGKWAFSPGYHQLSLTSVVFEDPDGWYVSDFAGNIDVSNDIADTSTAATYLIDTYMGDTWSKLDETQTILTLNIDGESTGYVVDKGSNVLSTVADLNTEITDMTSCGWFSDADFINSFEDTSATITTGMTLYTKMATLDKITITNGAVSAASTSIAGEVVIPRKGSDGVLVTEILSSGDTFAYCSGITSVYLPSAFETFGWYSFRDCTSLTKVNFPSSVKTIGACSFSGCSSLSQVIFAEEGQLTDIEGLAFWKCPITEVTIPKSVKLIDVNVFADEDDTLSPIITNVYFADCELWYIYEEDDTEGTFKPIIALTPEQVADSALMASYIGDTYRYCKFIKGEVVS